MVDRPGSGLDRLAQRRAAQGVHHDRPAPAGGFGHRGPDLVLAELGTELTVCGRQHAAGGQHLDPVGAGPHQPTDRGAELGRPVGQVRRAPGVVRQRVVHRTLRPRAGQEAIAVAPVMKMLVRPASAGRSSAL
jgi:hypothetical protein